MIARLSPAWALAACIALCLSTSVAVGVEDSRRKKSPDPSAVEPARRPTATPSVSTGLAPLDVRLKNASTVEVITDVLGVDVGTTVASAHERLDKLSDPAFPPKEEAEDGKDGSGEGERKILWRFAGTDYKALFVQADAEERITSITALLRPGREQPFDKVGDVRKAPVISDSEVAWDVVRPNRPLFRVVARGTNKKAETILIFLVQRQQRVRQNPDRNRRPLAKRSETAISAIRSLIADVAVARDVRHSERVMHFQTRQGRGYARLWCALSSAHQGFSDMRSESGAAASKASGLQPQELTEIRWPPPPVLSAKFLRDKGFLSTTASDRAHREHMLSPSPSDDRINCSWEALSSIPKR